MIGVENLTNSIFSNISPEKLIRLSPDSLGAFDILSDPLKCFLGFIGLSIGGYAGFFGLRAYILTMFAEGAILTAFNAFNQDVLAGYIEPAFYTSLISGAILYLTAGRRNDYYRSLND